MLDAALREIMTDEAWSKKLDKLRIYNIPSGVFIMFERLVSQLRFAIERLGPIRIGGTHGHSGTDRLAKLLNITLQNCWDLCIEAADVSGLDYSISAEDLSIFYSGMLLYEERGTPEYEIKRRILQYVIKNVVNQLVSMAGQWAVKAGGMPSGLYGTSHGDSFILLLWWCMFLVVQILSAPDNLRDKLMEAALDWLMIVIYGDDHLWNRTMDPEVTAWFNGLAFTRFLKLYKDVELRDQVCTSFASKQKHGYLVHTGAIFLKYYSVVNPYIDRPKQPTFIAFRETPEYIVRAVHGRIPRSRTCFDVILSLMGHSYGTYASNRDAYDIMALMYQNCLDQLGLDDEEVLNKIMVDLSSDDIADFRRKGIDVGDLIKGFPSWDCLISQNEYSPIHENNIQPGDPEAVLLEDYDGVEWTN